MALKEITNEDLKIQLMKVAGPPDLLYSTDPGIDLIKVVPTKSTTCKVGGKYICTTGITITWALPTPCPFSSATYNFVSGAASVLPSATKVKADGGLVLRKDDQSLAGCIGSWTLKVTPFTPMSCACTCKISDAGQTKVKGQ
jgi:hypothetical protein